MLGEFFLSAHILSAQPLKSQAVDHRNRPKRITQAELAAAGAAGMVGDRDLFKPGTFGLQVLEQFFQKTVTVASQFI